MQVITYNYLLDQKKVYEGNEQDVRSEIFHDYPYLLRKYGPEVDVDILVKDLDHSQMASAVISSVTLTKSEEDSFQTPDAQFYPQDEYLELLKEAAIFLAGNDSDPEKLRQALQENDGDEEVSVLVSVGLAPNPANLAALRGVVGVRLNKSEDTSKLITFTKIEAFNDSGTEFANAVKRAVSAGSIKEVHLKTGKHTSGTLLVSDPETFTKILLKPGAGKQNPALGESQNQASQSVREAAFYAVADAWGLSKDLPECHLLYLDDQEYAAMQFLPNKWVNGNDLRRKDPNAARRILSMFLGNGSIHRWAVMDYILANPDRNAGNVMFRDGYVKLIDHGSALAGIDFNPAFDGHAFVPYYLRVFASAGFGKMTPEQRLKALPRLNVEGEKMLGEWIHRLDKVVLQKLLIPYGIDPTPEIARLELLQFAVTIQAADLAVLSCWTIG